MCWELMILGRRVGLVTTLNIGPLVAQASPEVSDQRIPKQDFACHIHAPSLDADWGGRPVSMAI